MNSFIQEIQGDALNSDISVADVMRKALIVTNELKLEEFESWIRLELSGYPRPTKLDSADLQGSDMITLQGAWKQLPEYRWVPGTWQIQLHVDGRKIITRPHSELAKQLKKMPVPISISEIENIASTDATSTAIQVYDMATVIPAAGTDFDAFFWVATHYYHRILNTARNTILDWTMKLEASGILGEGLAFSTEEKQTASNFTFNIEQFIQQGGTKMNVEISHSTVGMLNTGEILAESITANVSTLNDSNQQQIAEALRILTDAVKSCQDVSSQVQTEILEQMHLISEQATLAPPERKMGLIKPTLAALTTTLSAGGGLAEIWSTWGMTIENFFDIG